MTSHAYTNKCTSNSVQIILLIYFLRDIIVSYCILNVLCSGSITFLMTSIFAPLSGEPQEATDTLVTIVYIVEWYYLCSRLVRSKRKLNMPCCSRIVCVRVIRIKCLNSSTFINTQMWKSCSICLRSTGNARKKEIKIRLIWF